MEGAIVQMTQELFLRVFPLEMYEKLDNLDMNSYLAIIDMTSNEVLRSIADKEQALFRTLAKKLEDFTYPFNSMNEETLSYSKGSILSSFLTSSVGHVVARKLIEERGYPVNSLLASNLHTDYYHTILTEVSLEGHLEMVQLLLDAGADVDENLPFDSWNSIVYGVFSESEDIVDFYKQRFPNHPVWTATNLSLEMKCLPKLNIFEQDKTKLMNDAIASLQNQGEVGSMADIQETIRKKKEYQNMQPATGGFGGFGGFATGTASGSIFSGFPSMPAIQASSNVFSFANNSSFNANNDNAKD